MGWGIPPSVYPKMSRMAGMGSWYEMADWTRRATTASPKVWSFSPGISAASWFLRSALRRARLLEPAGFPLCPGRQSWLTLRRSSDPSRKGFAGERFPGDLPFFFGWRRARCYSLGFSSPSPSVLGWEASPAC